MPTTKGCHNKHPRINLEVYPFYKGLELFWELVFSVLRCFFGSAFLPVFLSICSILELEAAISTVFATFWSWNLSCSIELFDIICNILELEAAVSTVFAAFLSSNLHFRWSLQHFVARTVHETW